MLRTLLRVAVPFLASLIGTYFLGQFLYPAAVLTGWFAAIPYWVFGAAIGFFCGVLFPQGHRWALKSGGFIASVWLALPLIANSLGFAFFVLFPFFVVYAAVQSAAHRYGMRYEMRLMR
ncbi:hypothetical protein [Variovorax sp. ZT4R33]|uniref:hypothetical protein n=1 Tax=Variovorax sp. ZT4R33 TaxID=3443743 RepID=UPI003F476ED9